MLIYEVNLTIDRSIEGAYAAYLPGHIEEILALPGFTGALWFERDPTMEGGLDGKCLWTIHYHLRDRNALEVYLRDHAPALREDAVRRFGNQFSATRRVLVSRR